jgi:excisionase family DNA binding protein
MEVMPDNDMQIPDNEDNVPLLTTREVAALLGIHQNTVRRWSDMGLLKSFRVSRRGDRRYRYEDIGVFLDGLNSGNPDDDGYSPAGSAGEA